MSPTQYSDGTWIYCSGTLISPTVFLTAAHCGEDGERVAVTFDTAYQAGDKVYAGTFHADPLYGQRQSDPHDIAVVVLDKPVQGHRARAAARRGLARLPRRPRQFTPVGYGAFEVTNGPGGHQYLYDDVRNQATGTLNVVNPAWLRISMNPPRATAAAATATPAARTSSARRDILAAITITGDAVCRATNVVYRLDTESAWRTTASGAPAPATRPRAR